MIRRLFLTLTSLLAIWAAVAATTAAAAVRSSTVRLTTPATTPLTTHHFAGLAAAVRAGNLDPRVASAVRRHGTADVIVTFAFEDALSAPTPHAGGRTVDAMSRSAVVRHRITVMKARLGAEKSVALTGLRGAETLRRWDFLPLSYVRVRSQRWLLHLVNRPGVLRVSASDTLRTMSTAHLSYIRQPQTQQAGYAGAGTYVGVVDTGVNYTNADFGSCSQPGGSCKVAAYKKVVPGDNNYLDDNGHGSNVASIVTQVAPGTKIIAYDVFAGSTTSDTYVASALNDLISMKSQGYRVVAANMSIGSNSGSSSDCSATGGQYAAEFTALRNAQILPVVSAGNSAGGGTTNYGLATPGCVSSALTVGATYDSNVGTKGWTSETPYCTDSSTWADKVTCFSQTGPGLDMLAPGSEIYGANSVYTGTSQAAPHVAGAVAVLAAAKPSANIDQIESALENTGPLVADSRYGVTITRHRLDLYSAVSSLLSSATPTMSLVTEQFPTNQQLTSTTIPVEFDYSASDPSGITAYDVWLSTDGGQFVEQTNLPSLTRSVWVTAALGHKYQLAVRAKNGNGVWGAYQYSNALSPSATDDKALQIASPWAFYTGDTYGPTFSATSTAGAGMNFNFTGRDVAVIAPEFSNAGLSTLYCDGSPQATINEYSASTIGRRIVGWCRFAQSGQHTVRIVNQGTSGGPWLAVDAFAVLS